MPKHIAEHCNLTACTDEANSWIVKDNLTLYLCENHAEEYATADGFVTLPNDIERELAVYECFEDCSECNA